MLPNSGEVSIEPSSDPEEFAFCARMMAETEPWITLGLDYDQCLKAFVGPFKEIFVLKSESGLLGFVIMQSQGTFKGYIQTLCISADHRGNGYGTRLLVFCQRQILQYSPNIFICVSTFNKGAIRLYTKFGFKLVGELNDFVKAGFSELLMRKTYGPIVDFKAHL